MNEAVKILTEKGKTIATMESCTGGGVANAITNIPGASEVLKFSAVTYATEYKIKMGVSKEIIDTYTVYSAETAKEMAYNISKIAESNYGIGVTGKLMKKDIHNDGGEDNVIYFCIYDKNNDKYYHETVKVSKETRKENKELVINKIIEKLLTVI